MKSKKNTIAVRAIFMSKEKKQKITSLPVLLCGEIQVKGSKQKMTNVISKLSTNENGYVSFKLPVSKIEKFNKVYISIPNREEITFPVLDFANQTKGEGVQIIKIPESIVTEIPRENLHSVQMADIIDYDYIPLFNTPTIAMSSATYDHSTSIIDNDPTNPDDKPCGCNDSNPKNSKYCQALVPSIMEDHCINLYSLNKQSDKDIILKPDKKGKLSGKKDLQLQHGTAEVFESCFTSIGYSLGSLLYSSSLAPCESVNLGVQNWFRKDITSQNQSTQTSEYIDNSIIKSKSTLEYIKSRLTEHKFNVGVSVAAKLSNLVSLGASIGYSFGSRTATAEMTQQINEHHKQLSSAYSTYNSLVVNETTQNEEKNITTRTIRNHNHCHTLNVMFYELIENIKVNTSVLGHHDCVFIKYDTPCFTEKDLVSFRHIFRETLLDKSLLECLDSLCLENYSCDCSGAATNTGGSEPTGSDCPATVNRLKIKIQVADRPNAPSEGATYVIIKKSDGTNDRYFIPHSPDNKYKKNKSYETEVDISPTCVTDIIKIAIQHVGKPPFPDGIMLSSIDIKYMCIEDPSKYYHLFGQGLGNEMYRNEKKDIDAPVNPETPDLYSNSGSNSNNQGVDPVQVYEECCVNSLLQHVNCNKMYYYKTLWMLEDENEIVKRFSDYKYGTMDLSDVINNKPIGVFGEWVAFLPVNSVLKPVTNPYQKEDIIHSPTGSMFSEAILGQCNSCEEIDDTRFWDWTGKTCPDSAPKLNELQGLSQYQKYELQSYDFKNKLLKLLDFGGLSSTSSLSTLVQTAIGKDVSSIPSFNKEILAGLITLLEQEDATSGSKPANVQDAIKDLLKKAKDLKTLYSLLNDFFGSSDD